MEMEKSQTAAPTKRPCVGDHETADKPFHECESEGAAEGHAARSARIIPRYAGWDKTNSSDN
jgi:hypothetical protein